MSYAKRFDEQQLAMKNHKLALGMRRALIIQSRNKIKPSSMNPNLLNTGRFSMRGGDSLINNAPIDFYYPAEDAVGEEAMDCGR